MMGEYKCLFMLMEWRRDSYFVLMVMRNSFWLQNEEVQRSFILEIEEIKGFGCKQWLKYFCNGLVSQNKRQVIGNKDIGYLGKI